MQTILARQHFTGDFPLHIMDVPQGPIAPHAHDFYEMVYIRRGRGAHHIDGVPYPIQSGDLYVISPGESHYYAPLAGQEMRIINILWMPELVDQMLHADEGLQGSSQLLYLEPMLRGETRFAHRLHLSGKTAFRVEALIDEMLREQENAGAGRELLLRHLFCALLVLLSRAYHEQSSATSKKGSPNPAQQVVEKAIAYIEAHHADAIRVDEVAAHTAMSPSRLAHLFKAHTDRGIVEYLHQYRVAQVCSALLQGDQPVQEIATAAGYSDLRFFHRIFRRYTGCNPSQFRQHFSNTAI